MRGGGRDRPEPLCVAAHGLPDLLLRHAPGERLRREGRRLPASQLRVHDVGRRGEALGDRAPAALLRARHRDAKRRPGRDQHADVQDPVLLRPDQLRAVVQQDVFRQRVRHGELGNVARLARLRDREPACERGVERDVPRPRIAEREQRRNDDPPVPDGISELEWKRGRGQERLLSSEVSRLPGPCSLRRPRPADGTPRGRRREPTPDEERGRSSA